MFPLQTSKETHCPRWKAFIFANIKNCTVKESLIYSLAVPYSSLLFAKWFKNIINFDFHYLGYYLILANLHEWKRMYWIDAKPPRLNFKTIKAIGKRPDCDMPLPGNSFLKFAFKIKWIVIVAQQVCAFSLQYKPEVQVWILSFKCRRGC